MDSIEYKNDLKKHVVHHMVKDQIIEKIKQIPKYETLRTDTELVLLVCNIVENVIKKKDGVDKKGLVVESLQTLFNLAPQEMETLKNNIEFLWAHNRIKKEEYLNYFSRVICNWITKKLL